jgi:hypothetical protein
MFTFREQTLYRPSVPLGQGNVPIQSVSFRINGLRSARPKGMLIDMNAGKGCHTCGGK